jgi:hypothetical protein
MEFHGDVIALTGSPNLQSPFLISAVVFIFFAEQFQLDFLPFVGGVFDQLVGKLKDLIQYLSCPRETLVLIETLQTLISHTFSNAFVHCTDFLTVVGIELPGELT